MGDEASDDFKKMGRKAGCYICHVKGEDKKKVRNEYGEALHKYLGAEDFPKDWVKENPEESKKKILEAFKKVSEMKSKDGKKYGDKTTIAGDPDAPLTTLSDTERVAKLTSLLEGVRKRLENADPVDE